MKTSLPSLHLLGVGILFGSLSTACAGKTLDVGTANSERQAGSGEAPVATRSADLDTICDSPHGPADNPTITGDFKTHLAGRWYRCDENPKEGAAWTVAGEGLELVPKDAYGGAYYALDFDASGNATRQQGLDGEGQYLVSYATASTVETFDDTVPYSAAYVSSQGEANAVPLANGSIAAHSIEFETGPRRMRIDGSIWFVSVDDLSKP